MGKSSDDRIVINLNGRLIQM